MDLEFKGTTGPWETFRHMASLTVGTKQMEICKVHFESGYNQNDANLIAAAPEMLEALKEAKLQIEYLHEKFKETGTGNSTLSKIDRVMLKALGK